MNQPILHGYDEDLEAVIRHVVKHGSYHAPGVVRGLDKLQADCAQIKWTLQCNDDDPWLQYMDAKIPCGDQFPAINALRDRITTEAHWMADYVPSLGRFEANDVTAQLYRDEHDGIDTHQDYSVDHLLIWVVTIQGSGPFEILSARYGGEVIERYETRPGSLILMRAPHLYSSDEDIRAPHRILKPQGERISLTFRYTVGEAKFKNQTAREAQ